MSLKQFAEEETERLEAESKKFQEEQDLPGCFIPEKGENSVEFLDMDVREKDFGQGIRKIFRIKNKEGEERDWALNPKNPIYREIVKNINEGYTKMNILRTGEKTATRYEIKSAEKSETISPETKDVKVEEGQ